MMAIPMLTMVLVAVLGLPQVPARDRTAPPAAPRTGTATISGVVMTEGDRPEPVRYASVAVSEGLMSIPLIAVSDAQGRFVFTGLPAGSYLLAATKPAWVTAAPGVQTMLGQGQGTPVAVKEGQAVSDITIRMTRGAVVSGVVVLSGGRPAAGMTVQALRSTRVDGRRATTMTAIPGTTDDQGRYRIFGLPAGEYVVQVRTELVAMQTLELRQTLPSDVRWAEALLAQSTAAVAPGMTAPDTIPAPEPGPTVTYAATYFPGTTYLTDAAGITLRAGEERLNMDFEMQRVPTAQVSGRVTGLDGAPAANAMVTLTLPAAAAQEDLFAQLLGAGRAQTRPDGTFVLSGVTPGRYELTVRAAPPPPPGAKQDPRAAQQAALAGMMSGLMGGGAGAVMAHWAHESIEVNGQPVGPLGMQLREGLKVAGSVVFEGDAPATLTNMRVSLADAASNTGMPAIAMFQPGMSTATAKDDGTFEVLGMVPGRYRVSVMMPGLRMTPTEPGSGWMVKSVMLEGRELADEGVEVTGVGDLAGLVVTLTDRPSELTGRVLDGASQPFSAYPLVVFSADRAQWGPGSRRVHAVQPATDGSYVIAGLPAGDYYLAAVTGLDVRELASAAFLEALIPAALRVSLSDGERKTQDVRLAGG